MTANAHRSPAARADAPRRVGWFRIIQVLCLIYAGFVLLEDAQELLVRAHVMNAGDVGGYFDVTKADRGFVVVQGLKPDTPLAQAGVAEGDKVRFDYRADSFRYLRVGQHVGFTALHAGHMAHHEVVARGRPADTPVDWLAVGSVLSLTVTALFGAFIVWRSRNITTLLLGMALLTYGLINALPQVLVSGDVVFPFALAVGFANFISVPVLFYAFAMRFYREQVAAPKPAEVVLFWLYAGGMSAVVTVNGFALSRSEWNSTGASFLAQNLLLLAGFGLCLIYLALGWRRSSLGAQQRYALILIAAAVIFVDQMYDAIGFQFDRIPILGAIHHLANIFLGGLVAPALLTYAIFRRKVFDLSFAVNRTLVYGVVSAILLAAFGAIEWAVDHFVPIQGREKNAAVDALIAVGVFLTFHRVRDAVEHGVEGLFFRRWQQAEATLRRFVREAAFFTDGSALAQAFARELGRYAEDAQAAVYLADTEGYALTAGDVQGGQSALDANLPALVSARADLKPVEVHEGALSGCLVAPMVNRNDVTGVAVLGAKPSGLSYRPDEIELIGWAARQVGLDLSALRIEELERERADLRSANAQLERLLGPINPSRSPA